MQIGLLNHLKYPGVGNQPAASSPTDDATADVGGAAPRGRGAAVRLLTPAQDAPGVIAKIQSGTGAEAGAPLPPGLVYSQARKAAAAEDTDADTARMAEQHRQAVERSAGAPSSLSLDKDGVLVSKPAATPDDAPQDFVHFAVHTMRQYADEQDRLKTIAKETEAANPAPLIPRSLADVHKLAARFKMFA